MAPGTQFIAVLTAILSACSWPARCERVPIPGLGCDACLISREIECDSSAEIPVNHFREFETRYAISLSPTCEPVPNGDGLQRLNFIGDEDRTIVFNSPGFVRAHNSNYNPSTLVEYNFQCPEGRLAYISMTNMSLEEPNCTDPAINNAKVCADFFRVFSSMSLNFRDSCGTDFSENDNKFENAIFRTSPFALGPKQGGFEGAIVCSDSDVRNEPGCGSDPNNRRKRGIYRTYVRQPNLRGRLSPQSLIDQGYLSARVPNGAGITYYNGVLRFTDNRDNVSCLSRLPDIRHIFYFTNFDGLSDPRTFVLSARKYGRYGSLLRFPGPGLLFYKDRFAYYQGFIIDPQLLPTDEEKEVIIQLIEAIQNFFRNRSTMQPPTTPPQPPRNITWPQNTLRMACASQSSCNPPLRAVSMSIITSSSQDCDDGPGNMP